MPTAKLPDRLMPLATAAGVVPLYGDIHNHCNISYGHGSLESALEHARAQLDFVSVTGHAYWPDMPVDEPSVADIVDFHRKGFARLKKVWPGHFEVLKRYDSPGEFAVFAGYEMHSSAHGDHTIMLKNLDRIDMPKADSPAGLLVALRDAYGPDAMAFPHHIGYRTGARGINWDSFDERLSPVLEMISMHGCSETSLVDRPFLHSMGPCDGANTVHAGWSAGKVFGVIGNTDHHSGYPGSYGHGRGAVYAGSSSRQAIWDAIHERRTNALTGDNIHLFARLNDATIGDVVSPTDRATIEIEAVGGSFIDYIDVIRNGQVIERITPSLTPRPISDDDKDLETLLVVELGWGRRGRHHDWVGRISLDNGTFISVEPRLRGPEILSPLDGDDAGDHRDRVALHGDAIDFDIRAFANTNNVTPAMQTIASHVRLRQDAKIRLDIGDQSFSYDAERLVRGAVSENLGTIDSPAFRLHPLPSPRDWQWSGSVDIGALSAGDWLSLRLRQLNGQYAWSSAFFVRD